MTDVHHSAIYDPRRDITPSQRAYAAAHVSRQVAMTGESSASPYLGKVGRPPASAPDYRCMWFYNLVVETERMSAQILAAPCRGQYVRIDEIQRAVCDYYNISMRDMLSISRVKHVTRPRQIAYYLAKMLTARSLPDIGSRFKRDHASVHYGIKKIARLRSEDQQLNIDLLSLAEKLGGSIA